MEWKGDGRVGAQAWAFPRFQCFATILMYLQLATCRRRVLIGAADCGYCTPALPKGFPQHALTDEGREYHGSIF
jgi:hypothetical protein